MEMECSEIDELLVEYHFAASPPARRDHVHAHLLDCSPCARRYLNLKQSIEQSAELGLRPSENARLRLRSAVGRLAEESRSRRSGSSSKLAALRRFFRTPVPRYQVAAAVLLVLLGAFATRLRAPGSGEEARPEAPFGGARPFPMVVNRELPREAPELRSQPVQLLVLPSGQRAVIDSARSQAVSLTFY
jgi:hypothetical protein